MSEPDRNDGYYRIPLSQELQGALRATDQPPPTLDQLTKLNLEDADLHQFPWENTPKKAAGLKVIIELLSYIKDWPGKENMTKEWTGGDLVLFQKAVITDKNERNLYVPRPFPAIQGTEGKVKAIIHNTRTNVSKTFSWDESHAFLLDEDVRVIVMNTPIRFFLLRIWLTTKKNNEQDRV